MMSLEPMQFVTNTYSGTGAVEPASLGNHLPVALDWSKHHIHSRTEKAAENETQSRPDNGLSEKTLL